MIQVPRALCVLRLAQAGCCSVSLCMGAFFCQTICSDVTRITVEEVHPVAQALALAAQRGSECFDEESQSGWRCANA